MDTLERVRSILLHIKHVRENTEILGEKLIKEGEVELGIALIANGLIHDNSKLRQGIEFDHLAPDEADKKMLIAAIKHHSRSHSNLHHPEAHIGGIKNMPRVYLAEMICDVKARSSEFGTSIESWIVEEAMQKYGFNKSDKVYSEIMYFLNLLLDRKFEKIKSA